MDLDRLQKMTVGSALTITINYHLPNYSTDILTAIMFKLLRNFKSILLAKTVLADSKDYSLTAAAAIATGRILKMDQLLRIERYSIGLKGNYRIQQIVVLAPQILALSTI